MCILYNCKIEHVCQISARVLPATAPLFYAFFTFVKSHAQMSETVVQSEPHVSRTP